MGLKMWILELTHLFLRFDLVTFFLPDMTHFRTRPGFFQDKHFDQVS